MKTVGNFHWWFGVGVIVAVLIVGTLVKYRSTTDGVQSNQNAIPPDIASEKAYYYYDSLIRHDFKLIEQALSCHFSYNQAYPSDLQSFDKRCFPLGSAPINHNTGKSYNYTVANRNREYTLRAKLSTGEIYTITSTKVHPTQSQ